MKLSARLQKDFWAELKEDQPDLVKLNVIGSQITRAVPQAKSHYKELLLLTMEIPASIHFAYSNFMINILNEKEEGLKLLYRAREI